MTLLKRLQQKLSEIIPRTETVLTRSARLGYILAMGAFMSVGVWCIMTVGPMLTQIGWTDVDASLVKAELNDDLRTPALKVSYKYSVGGRTFAVAEIESIARIRDIAKIDENADLSDLAILQKAKSDIEKRKNLTAYYNPFSPGESRLVPLDLFHLFSYSILAVISLGLHAYIFSTVFGRPNRFAPPPIPGHDHPSGETRAVSMKQHPQEQEAVDSPREQDFAAAGQITSSSPDAMPSKSTADDTALDGSTINIKQREKDILE